MSKIEVVVFDQSRQICSKIRSIIDTEDICEEKMQLIPLCCSSFLKDRSSLIVETRRNKKETNREDPKRKEEKKEEEHYATMSFQVLITTVTKGFESTTRKEYSVCAFFCCLMLLSLS